MRAAFARYPWLAGLHVRVGSQGCALSQLIDGIGRVEALRQELRRAMGPLAAGTMDIGGGLPVACWARIAPALEDYAAALRRSADALPGGDHADHRVQALDPGGLRLRGCRGWST